MDEIFLGATRAVKFAATDDDGNPIEDATVTMTAYDDDQQPHDITPVTRIGNVYRGTVLCDTTGTWRAIAKGSATDTGVGVDEWRVIDPAATP